MAATSTAAPAGTGPASVASRSRSLRGPVGRGIGSSVASPGPEGIASA